MVVEAVIAVEVIAIATRREFWLTRSPEQLDNRPRLQVVQLHNEVANPSVDEVIERDGHVGDLNVIFYDNVICKAAITIRDVAATT